MEEDGRSGGWPDGRTDGIMLVELSCVEGSGWGVGWDSIQMKWNGLRFGYQTCVSHSRVIHRFCEFVPVVTQPIVTFWQSLWNRIQLNRASWCNFNLSSFSSALFIALSHSDFEGTFVRGHSWTDRGLRTDRPTAESVVAAVAYGRTDGRTGRGARRKQLYSSSIFSVGRERLWITVVTHRPYHLPRQEGRQAELGQPISVLLHTAHRRQAGAGLAAASLSLSLDSLLSRGLLFRKALLVRRSVGRSVYAAHVYTCTREFCHLRSSSKSVWATQAADPRNLPQVLWGHRAAIYRMIRRSVGRSVLGRSWSPRSRSVGLRRTDGRSVGVVRLLGKIPCAAQRGGAGKRSAALSVSPPPPEPHTTPPLTPLSPSCHAPQQPERD